MVSPVSPLRWKFSELRFMNLKDGFFKKCMGAMRPAAPIFDFLLAPLTLIAIVWFRIIRYWGIKNLKISQALFLRLGMLPVVNHYYEPMIDYRKLPTTMPKNHLRFDGPTQLKFIEDFDFGKELLAFSMNEVSRNKFHYHNGSFESGDAELYYSIIRRYKPRKILEVGSGFSTLMALEAIEKTKGNDSKYDCEMTCIEPYEMQFLESLNIKLIRQRVEQVDSAVFRELEKGDILFIDSSHIIRPGGDVNFLILETLSELRSGVLIHFHDIFTPYHYPREWLKDEFRLWNEQYLLEAFMAHNHSFEIAFSFGYMLQHHRDLLTEKFPVLKTEPRRVPGSLWLRKVV